MKKFKLLVCCEESQRVCTAFRERSWEEYSCDIEPESGSSRMAYSASGKQQKNKADGDTWYCERCGEKLRRIR